VDANIHEMVYLTFLRFKAQRTYEQKQNLSDIGTKIKTSGIKSTGYAARILDVTCLQYSSLKNLWEETTVKR
jgi:hypothetical protein